MCTPTTTSISTPSEFQMESMGLNCVAGRAIVSSATIFIFTLTKACYGSYLYYLYMDGFACGTYVCTAYRNTQRR